MVSFTRTVAPTLPRFAAALCLAAAVFVSACSVLTPERNLAELVLQDSTYLVPETRTPYTGDVLKYFPDQAGKVQLRGHMREGLWNGEITVYHTNGRIRYLGELADGVKCGVWTENMDPDPPKSLYKELRQEIESMGLYPPCPEG
jgi:hypothetical protein